MTTTGTCELPPVTWHNASPWLTLTRHLVRQAVDLRALLWEMQGILQDYCTRFWGTLGTVQCARGLLATPFPLCSMSLGVHLSARPRQATQCGVHCELLPQATVHLVECLCWLV